MMYLNGLLGGMIIGLSVVLLMGLLGRTLGVSGIVSGLLKKPSVESGWRLMFVLGLMVGGFVLQSLFSVNVVVRSSLPVLLIAGLCVGFGAVIGNGCTSGHGVCGIARFSKRSMIATITFMAAGILTVWLKNRLGV